MSVEEGAWWKIHMENYTSINTPGEGGVFCLVTGLISLDHNPKAPDWDGRQLSTSGGSGLSGVSVENFLMI